MNKKKVIIIHFLPLEIFPPVMNLCDYLSNLESQYEVTVFSTKASTTISEYVNPNIKIFRFLPINPSAFFVFKIFRYLSFYVFTFIKIVNINSSRIIYFETISSLPALLYKFLNKKVQIFVHYHEIVTLEELKRVGGLVKFLNKYEVKFYESFKWISQTNSDRMNIFVSQYRLEFNPIKFKVLPNYPPRSWISHPVALVDFQRVIRLLYIGSLEVEKTYIHEVLDYFGSNPNYTIDFFSFNYSVEVLNAISRHSNCRMRGGVSYQEIPKLIGLYDAGLVMYKGHSLNVEFCAPNKLFEYLALGLDVWCSDKLISAKKFERIDCYPKVIFLDFSKLALFDVDKALDKTKLEYVASPYLAEKAYYEINCVLNESTDS